MSKIFLTNKDRKLSLLESNVIFAAENDEIEFDLSDFSFKMIFKTDLSRKESYSSSKIIDGIITIDIYNLDALGAGLFSPVQIGEINNKKIFLAYIANSLFDKQYKLEYSLYTEE